MAEKLTGARLFARTLQAYGVTHVFFMDAVLRRALAEMEDFNITRVLGHSEKAVAYMADGYARVSASPACAWRSRSARPIWPPVCRIPGSGAVRSSR